MEKLQAAAPPFCCNCLANDIWLTAATTLRIFAISSKTKGSIRRELASTNEKYFIDIDNTPAYERGSGGRCGPDASARQSLSAADLTTRRVTSNTCRHVRGASLTVLFAKRTLCCVLRFTGIYKLFLSVRSCSVVWIRGYA
ncbi:unnamed protein product [Leptosia nina]|uniref:Uncharacterized protein n=1 Tax=Leptosia nina TaxID=320188 RepID=A0AAV1J404_9NEOP